jgi:methionyl-tRNA formyltransferase
MKSLRIIFMGTPEFSVPILQSLIDADFNIIGVYTQPPRPTGRGKKSKPSAIQLYADKQNIPVLTPFKLNNIDEEKRFLDFQPDIVIVVAYGMLLTRFFLSVPKLGCLNIHASLLPRWRGAAPIQRAIEVGDLKTGITIMQMVEELDAGDILFQKEISVTSEATSEILHGELAALGAEMIVSTLQNFNSLRAKPQLVHGVTYAHKLIRDEGLINWGLSASDLERKIRAFIIWPGTWFEWRGKRIKILKAKVRLNQLKATAGTLLDESLVVACKEDALQLLQVQVEGKRAMSGKDFVNGYRLKTGSLII